MLKKSRNGLQWYEFEQFAEFNHLKHTVFTRKIGQSQGAFESLNVSFSVGDREELVQSNLKSISNQFECEFVRPCQVHGDLVVGVNSVCQPECDGIATKTAGLGLMISHADCQAAIFYDPVEHAVANVHCGWRGNVLNIYEKTIAFMKDTFKSKPENILVSVSPSLGPEKAEFVNYKKEFPESFWEFQVRPNYFDLWAISEVQLQKAGILPGHIEVAKLCTFDNKDEFYSYRRDKVTGRNATCVILT